MKLRTTFWGGDVLFEGDLPLVLHAIPAGARVTRAKVTLAPAKGQQQAKQFHEAFPISDGTGDFGLAVQTGAGWAIVDLAARRMVERVQFATLAAVTGIRVQLDLGGMWMQIDENGNPTQADPSHTFTPTNSSLVLPNPVSQRLRLAEDSATLDVTEVSLLTYPSNLSLRLGSLGPFWFRTGDLREAVTTPDFADIFQGFLTGSQPANGVYEVPFILHSDTLARLRLALEVEYHLEQPLLAPPLSRVVLPFAYDAVASAQPAAIKASLPLNAEVLPQETSAYVSGRFAASRVIHGAVEATVIAGTVHVSPEESIAHAIRLETAQTASAIDLHLEAVTETARLLVTLQEDVGGKPWGDSLLTEPIEVRLERPAAGGSMWASAPLPAGFTFEADRIYWLIVNTADGEVNWAVEAAAGRPALQVTRDRGLSWRTVQAEKVGGPAAGLYRLRAEPAAFRQPIKLQVSGHEVSLRDLDALGKVDFRLDLPEMAEAFDAALADAVQQQASLSERVANGDFGRWTRIERQARRVVTTPLASPAESTPASTCLAVAPDASRLYYLTGRSVQESQSYVPEILVIANEPQPYLVDTLSWTGPQLSPGRPFSLAISPDGQSLYVVGEILDSELGQPAVWKVPVQGDAQAVVEPLPRLGTRLAVTADCRRLYVATHGGPVLFRMNAQDLTWDPDQDELSMDQHKETVSDLLVTPDGKRAYLAVRSGIMVIDLEAWTETGLSWFDPEAAPELVNLELSCDGKRLYAVALSSTSEAPRQPGDRLVNIGRAGSQPPVRQHLFALDTALLDRAAAGSLAFADTILAQMLLGAAPFPDILQRMNLGTMIPQRAAVTPDDSRLLVAAGLTYKLYTVDTTSDTLLDAIELPPDAYPFGLVVTPDSRRVFVNGIQVNEDTLDEEQLQIGFQLQAVELDAWTADDWALTAGRVLPVIVPEAEKPTARLGSPTGSTGLSQVFPVAGGQEYELHFRARADAPGAEAEIFWLSEDCGLVGEVSVDIKQPPCGAGLQHHALRSMAPAGADRAELRFRQPAGGYVLLDDVSFVAPAEATANSDLGATEEVPVLDPATGEPVTDPVTGEPVTGTLPQGWQVEPAPVVAGGGVRTVLEFLDGSEAGVRLTGPTDWPSVPVRRTAVLRQVLAITSGEPFVLEFRAFPHGQPSEEGNATLALRWTGGQAEPVTYELTPLRFDVTALDGTVPADATGAELVFSQPPGGSLDIVYARLSQPDLVEVPVTFLSEAPGNLTVEGPVVAYDLGDEPRPTPAPAAGAGPGAPPEAGEQPGQGRTPGAGETQEPVGCRPTPPEDVPSPPGGALEAAKGVFLAEPEVTYCPCCENIHFLDEPETVFSESGMEGVSGTCPRCQASVVMFPTRSRLATGPHGSTRRPVRPAMRRMPAKRSRAKAETRVVVAPGALPGVHEPAVAPPAAPLEAEAPATPPLTAIEGIGEARAAQLAKIGVDSVAKLAQSTPERIATALTGVSVEMAAEFIKAAKQLGFG